MCFCDRIFRYHYRHAKAWAFEHGTKTRFTSEWSGYHVGKFSFPLDVSSNEKLAWLFAFTIFSKSKTVYSFPLPQRQLICQLIGVTDSTILYENLRHKVAEHLKSTSKLEAIEKLGLLAEDPVLKLDTPLDTVSYYLSKKLVLGKMFYFDLSVSVSVASTLPCKG